MAGRIECFTCQWRHKPGQRTHSTDATNWRAVYFSFLIPAGFNIGLAFRSIVDGETVCQYLQVEELTLFLISLVHTAECHMHLVHCVVVWNVHLQYSNRSYFLCVFLFLLHVCSFDCFTCNRLLKCGRRYFGDQIGDVFTEEDFQLYGLVDLP